jgi:hypothetical protein
VRRSAAALLSCLAACLVLTGCGVGMPESGPVHETSATGSHRDDGSVSIRPLRPGKGDSPDQIVRGFIDAMRATPAITTSVARQFLTRQASTAWQPTGMVIYGRVVPPRGNNKVEVTLTDAARTDGRGAWLGPVPEGNLTVEFPMALDDGEWRISEPPPFLIVSQAWFAQRFQQASLYFFDPSAKILVPEPVFVPRGRQFLSSLVNGLLQVPSPELAGTEQSYFPRDLRSLSVPVSESGVAQVDLTSDTAAAPVPSPEQIELMVSQLAWTLRQDPTISRFRVTIDGRPVQLPNEQEFSVDHGHQYAPYVAGSSTQLFGLQDGLMVGGSPQNLEPVDGPFGVADHGLRTVAPDLRAEQVAGVSAAGDTLSVAPVRDTGEEPQDLITTGEDLLTPAWDFRGRLWEVDRRKTGAVVYYLDQRTERMVPLAVDGISGEDVKGFLISRDGSRLIALIRGGAEEDSIVVSRIVSTGEGQVVGALSAENIPDPDNLNGQIRDIAWRSPTSIAVLQPINHALFQVRNASVDGAPLADPAVTIDEPVASLIGTPVDGEPIYVFIRSETRTALADLAGPRGERIDVDPALTMLAYVN